MKLNLKFAVIFFIPTLAFAQPKGLEEAQALGLPMPGTGIQIVPSSQLFLTKEMREEQYRQNKEYKAQGFANSNSTYPRQLLYKGTAGVKLKMASADDQSSSELRKQLSDIKLAFSYSPIPNLAKDDVIGFAPMGGWHNGWTGFKEVFNQKELGTCTFSVVNIGLIQGAAKLDQDLVTYEVHKKPTVSFIEGSPSNGFMYSVTWYDNTYVREIECANMKYNKNILTQIIQLAKNIDI